MGEGRDGAGRVRFLSLVFMFSGAPRRRGGRRRWWEAEAGELRFHKMRFLVRIEIKIAP